MTNSPINDNLPPIEPLDLSEIRSDPVRIAPADSHERKGGKRGAAAGAGADGAGAGAGAAAEEDDGYEAVEPGEVLIRKRKRRSSRTRAIKKRRRRIAVAALAVLLVFAACFATVSIGDYTLHHNGYTGGLLMEDSGDADAVAYNEGRTVEYNGATYAYKENMVSILFMGYDLRTEDTNPSQADAIIMLAFDTDTGKVTGIVVPRESMVAVDTVIGDVFTGQRTMQVCLAFSYGSGGADSCEYTSRAVSRLLFNIPVSAYFALNMQGVAVLNDAIGGVALTPLDTIPSAGAVAGVPTVLVGDQAMAYVQTRGGDADSSLHRQERQIQYVKAFASQALAAAKGDVGVLLDLYGIATDYSITNLGLAQYSYLATCVVSHGITGLETTTLPGTLTMGTDYAEYHVDSTGVFETILDTYYVKLSDSSTGAGAGAGAGGADAGTD